MISNRLSNTLAQVRGMALYQKYQALPPLGQRLILVSSITFATILNPQSLGHRGHRGRARGHGGNAFLCDLGLSLCALCVKNLRL
jgi:hypothetical protein